MTGRDGDRKDTTGEIIGTQKLKVTAELGDQKNPTHSYLVPELLGLLTKLLQLTHVELVRAVTCWLERNFNNQT